jgi:hypothetical protein
MGAFVDLAWDTDSVQTVLKTEMPSSPENLQQPKAQKDFEPSQRPPVIKKERETPSDIAIPNL